MGLLDDILDTIKNFPSDLKTATQPGALSDLGGFVKEALPKAGEKAQELTDIGRSYAPLPGEQPREKKPGDVSDILGQTTGMLGTESKIGEAKPPTTPIADSLIQAAKPKSRELIKPGDQFEPQFKPSDVGTPITADKTTGEIPTEPAATPAAGAIRRWMNNREADRTLTPGDTTKTIIRDLKGGVTQREAQEGAGLAQELSNWYVRPTAESRSFMHSIETGDFKGIANPADRATAYELSNSFLRRANEVNKLSERDGEEYFESYVKNYFPHIWKDPDQAKDFFDAILSRRTAAEGSKAFLRDRNYDLIDEGLKAGLKLKTENPIENALMKNSEIDRFLMGHEIKDNMLKNGVVMEAGKDVPKGWVKLNDSMFGNKSYYAPADAAKIFDRYFSPGLLGSPVYDAFRGISNTMTMAQLGLSGFHYLTDGFQSSISDLALAGEQAASGKFGEAFKSAGTAASIVGSPSRDFVVGGKMMQEYLHPGSYLQYAREAQAVKESGGRIGLDPIYLNKGINSFRSAIHDGNWSKAIAKSLPAFFEMMSHNLMNTYVPRLKLGAFQRLAAHVLEESQVRGLSELQTKAAMQQAWDSIDNRFGQLEYSNLFWRKAAKDLSLITMRAPGWNIGTVRELGGGLLDLTKQTGRFVADQKFDLTHRMAYGMAMTLMSGYLGGATHWIMTGQFPSQLKDYFYPGDGTRDKDGNMNRINPIGYVKDVVNGTNHPWRTAISKLNPALTATYEMINNRDWQNTQIWEPATAPQDIAKYLAEQFTPFSIKNARQKAGDTFAQSVGGWAESLIGILPAPREMVKTPAQNLLTDYMSKQLPAGPRSKEDKAKQDYKSSLEDSYRRGVIGISDLIKARGTGKISDAQLQSIVKYKNVPTIARDITRLSNPDEVFEVYQKANPNEKLAIGNAVRSKLLRAMDKSQDVTEKKKWADKLLSIAGPVKKESEVY